MLPDSSTSVTHREEWFGPEDIPKEILLYFISIPQVLEWFCSYKKLQSAGYLLGVYNNKKGTAKLLRNGYMYVHRRNLSEGSSIWESIYRRKGY